MGLRISFSSQSDVGHHTEVSETLQDRPTAKLVIVNDASGRHLQTLSRLSHFLTVNLLPSVKTTRC